MLKRRYRILLGGLSFLVGLFLCAVTTYAESYCYYTNEDTGYSVIIDDEADLLTDDEEWYLADEMYYVTYYGNAAFVTTDNNASSASRYAESCYRAYFGTDSGTLFLIDLDNRDLWFFSDGAVYKTLNKSYSDTIADNIYRYASDGDYYGCAYEAFAEVLEILDGGRIAQPMKYISNVLLSLIIAFLISFGIVYNFAKKRAASKSDLLSAIKHNTDYTNITITETGVTKEYSPRSSGSGGGHGGGGHSGGGGGHGF